MLPMSASLKDLPIVPEAVTNPGSILESLIVDTTVGATMVKVIAVTSASPGNPLMRASHRKQCGRATCLLLSTSVLGRPSGAPIRCLPELWSLADDDECGDFLSTSSFHNLFTIASALRTSVSESGVTFRNTLVRHVDMPTRLAPAARGTRVTF